MHCEICQAFSETYCVCDDVVDDGKPITGGRRSDEMRIRVDKYSEYVDSLMEKHPRDKSLKQLRDYFRIPKSTQTTEEEN